MSDYKPRNYDHRPTAAEKRELGKAGDGHGYGHHTDRDSRTRPVKPASRSKTGKGFRGEEGEATGC